MSTKFYSFRTIVAVCLGLLLVLTTACSRSTSSTPAATQETQAGAKPGEEANPKDRPLYTIKVLTNMAINPNIKKSDENEMGKFIKEKFNIVFEYLPYTGDFVEKANLLLATGDYPEMLTLAGTDLIKTYVDAGAAIDLEKYFAVAPNFEKAFATQLPYWRSYSDDNKVHHWEVGVGGETAGTIIMDLPTDVAVRSDALEKQGWPNIVRQDDFIAFLKQAMKDFPEINGQKTVGMTLPLAEPWGLQGIAGIGYEKGEKYTSASGNNAVIWSILDKKFTDYFLNENVRESLAFFNTLYREGLLDPESFTDKYPQTTDKMKAGKALSTWYAVWSGSEANQGFVASGKPEMKYVTSPFQLESQADNNEKRVMAMNSTNSNEAVVITNKAKDPERIMEFINWTLSEEGQVWRQAGIEGKTYTVQDGNKVLLDEYKKNLRNFDWLKQIGLAYEFRFIPSINGKTSNGQHYSLLTPEIMNEVAEPRMNEAIEKMGLTEWYDKLLLVPTDFVNSISLDTKSEEGRLEPKLIDFRNKMSAKLILAKTKEEFNGIYDAAVADYKKMKPEIVIDAYNKQYQEKMKEITK
ncbi:extracellular solute-binding protein [Paenibacillus eucommiae]|uniref:ABC-type glycerol-3-phosphate transport system substrate-binding protein n=1 Tax=Paenibacillus eucommiae TaxID=1355755 RepID=A0ABS4J8B5_9BACL|nr:extracellular solute-binding protein [Paenibacillus eucommiae]MBP1996080.1 ABC-type glycerol-3-phosphate transport system substrate-binding protein [Paenibacillus eucommiae]